MKLNVVINQLCRTTGIKTVQLTGYSSDVTKFVALNSQNNASDAKRPVFLQSAHAVYYRNTKEILTPFHQHFLLFIDDLYVIVLDRACFCVIWLWLRCMHVLFSSLPTVFFISTRAVNYLGRFVSMCRVGR